MKIVKVSPNPIGKDNVGGTPVPLQLLREWVDIRNDGALPVKVSSLALANNQFNNWCQITKQNVAYWYGTSSLLLRPGESARIHTGAFPRDGWAGIPTDAYGDVTYHFFANRSNFVLNNKCGDTVTLWLQGDTIDKWKLLDEFSYPAEAPEGTIWKK